MLIYKENWSEAGGRAMFHVSNEVERLMKARLLLATFVLATAPGLALAMGCNGYHSEEITMSCPEGQTLDVQSNTCITPTG